MTLKKFKVHITLALLMFCQHSIKLNKKNGILSKLRHFIDRKVLKSIYHAIIEPHLYYSSLAWAQNSSFLSHNAHTSPLFRQLSILKLPDKIVLFINKYFNKCLPKIFKKWFTLSSNCHTYNTRCPNLGCIFAPPITLNYMEGTLSILVLSTYGIIYRN